MPIDNRIKINSTTSGQLWSSKNVVNPPHWISKFMIFYECVRIWKQHSAKRSSGRRLKFVSAHAFLMGETFSDAVVHKCIRSFEMAAWVWWMRIAADTQLQSRPKGFKWVCFNWSVRVICFDRPLTETLIWKSSVESEFKTGVFGKAFNLKLKWNVAFISGYEPNKNIFYRWQKFVSHFENMRKQNYKVEKWRN